MTKTDKITFWIIESLIIMLILFGAYRIWDICHEIPENYNATISKEMTWPIRLYRHLPGVSVLFIIVGTIMNTMALFCRKLKSFKESSYIERVFIRLYAATIGLISSYIVLLLISIIIK